jgi:hypothetical protein
MQPHDVERIARDVVTTFGLQLSVQPIERSPDGWRVTLADAAHRPVVVELLAGTPASIRAALTQWAERYV